MSEVVPVLLAGLTSYGLYLCYQNITRLRSYEEQAEKAAKWSSAVADRLHRTRSTQTSGTLTLLVSLGTCIALFFNVAPNKYFVIPAGLLNALALFASRSHMADFWNERTQVKVPFVEKFNEAIRGSEAVCEVLRLLCIAWADAALLGGLGLSAVRTNLAFVVTVGAMWMYVVGPAKRKTS